ncbi:PQQ-binding-like beta-propeller repeat protein [Thermodesulfovibrionales bacterium]|nr:PQQ-binding-like beta-propeller repeat protein [Thermodesulfovibrionales bacterium]
MEKLNYYIIVGSIGWFSSLYALNPDGSLKWSFETPAGFGFRSSPATAADGTIYVGSGDDRLYALNPDGSLKWSFGTGGDVDSSPAITPDGTIIVGSNDGRIYAFWEDNGGPADSPWPMFLQNLQRTGRQPEK